jgi:serine phosphatase RsbU (regulator of sigma subunit)
MDSEITSADQLRAQLRRQQETRGADVMLSVATRHPMCASLRGGDVFESIFHPNGSATVLIADVSSKGTDGLAHAETLRQTFVACAHEKHSPSTTLSILNRVRFEVHDPLLDVTFASAFVAHLDRSTPWIRYASAGHELAITVQGTNHEHLIPTGPVLGVFRDPIYDDGLQILADDDLLLLATDGFTECRHRANSSLQFGTLGLLDALRSWDTPWSVFATKAVVLHADTFCGGLYRDEATIALVSRAVDQTYHGGALNSALSA